MPAEMPTYLLTVITPVYNGAAFIERCLRNVLEQDCESVEHLVMDGGSCDGTAEIVRRFALECPRIRLVSERDAGQSDAMNKGARLAAAPILSFLNVDDTYEPGVLRKVLALFEDLPEPGFLVGNCNVCDEQGDIVWVNRPSHLRLDDLLVGSLKMPTPMNPSSYFYHRSLHDVAGFYDVNDAYAMDLDFLLRALPLANTRYVDEVWGNFNMLPGAKTFEDASSGRSSRRTDIILKRELAKLPPRRRFAVQGRRAIHKLGKVPALIAYYSKNREKLLQRLRFAIRPAAALVQTVEPAVAASATGEESGGNAGV